MDNGFPEIESQTESILGLLFPGSENLPTTLKMMAEIPKENSLTFGVAGVLERKMNSKTLGTLLEEYRLNSIAIERGGRKEAARLTLEVKRQKEESGP